MGLRPTEGDEKPPRCHPRVGGGPGLDSRFRGNDGEGRFSRGRRRAFRRREKSRIEQWTFHEISRRLGLLEMADEDSVFRYCRLHQFER